MRIPLVIAAIFISLSAGGQTPASKLWADLATKREALQQQIEALEQFDREYRSRLTTFMQNQLRALWVDEPQVSAEIGQPESAAGNAE